MKKKLSFIISTVFYAGYSPFAPGTVGTALGIPLYFLVHNLNPVLYIILTLALFGIGILAANVVESEEKTKDPSIVIFDETVSFLITMFLITPSIFTITTGFILNRFFDITKIYPACLVDKKVKGGFGIMLDDLIAGIYSNIVLHAIVYFIAA